MGFLTPCDVTCGGKSHHLDFLDVPNQETYSPVVLHRKNQTKESLPVHISEQIIFGDGWCPLEVAEGGSFRWLGKCATIELRDLKPSDTLVIEHEYPHGLGSIPLKVEDRRPHLRSRRCLAVKLDQHARTPLRMSLRIDLAMKKAERRGYM